MPAWSLAQTSATWGVDGELFDPSGRLMDWSYAGYRHGELELPFAPIDVDITDFGAVPDDAGDDTAAFTAAIDAVSGGGVVFVPAGTFVLRAKLTLSDGVVLRGAGRERTLLDVPVSLSDVYGNPGLDGGGTSTYSFGQAFIEGRGSMPGTVLATVTANAPRGSTTLQVSSTDGLSPGQWLRLSQTDVGGALIDRLHADLMQGGDDNIGDRWEFHSRISAVGAGSIELERALPLDIDTAWSPSLHPFAPTITEIGVEHLSIRFPLTTYPGHFNEQGFNAIHFNRVANSWVRDVRISNADYGVSTTNCFFVTVGDVILDTSGDRGSLVGHHGLNNGHGGDNLFIGFDIRTTFVHDLTNEWYATGVVFTKGRGDNLRMDHHRAAPYLTLWTELDTGAGSQAWTSGGSSNRGPHTAAYDTLWNVRAEANMVLPPDNYGPRMNFIGFQTSATSTTSPYDWWLETIEPSLLAPPNIWEAMVARRLGPRTTVFSAVPHYGDAANYLPRTPSRWEVADVDGDLRYRIRTSSYESDGDGLGEYALVEDRSFADFVMSLEARSAEDISVNTAADYAVVFGYQDAGNYYYLMANATQGYSQLFAVQAGVRAELATAPVALIPDQGWHGLELSRAGSLIRVQLDGSEVMSISDSTFGSGAVGVGSFNDAVAFDNIDVLVPALDAGIGLDASVDDAAMTDAPMTDAAMTDGPMTDGPMTDGPMTDAPTTDAPMTDGPMSDAPMTDAGAVRADASTGPGDEREQIDTGGEASEACRCTAQKPTPQGLMLTCLIALALLLRRRS